MQHRHRRRRLHPVGGRPAAPRHGDLPPAPARSTRFRDKLVEGMVGARLRARLRRALLQADRGLRRLRLPGEPCGQLRAAGLRLGLAQVPLPGGLRLRAAEQPADGLLRPGPDRPRRRASTASRCGRSTSTIQRLGLHAGARPTAAMSRSGSASARSRGCARSDARALVARARQRSIADPDRLWRRAGLRRAGARAAGPGRRLRLDGAVAPRRRCGPCAGSRNDAAAAVRGHGRGRAGQRARRPSLPVMSLGEQVLDDYAAAAAVAQGAPAGAAARRTRCRRAPSPRPADRDPGRPAGRPSPAWSSSASARAPPRA